MYFKPKVVFNNKDYCITNYTSNIFNLFCLNASRTQYLNFTKNCFDLRVIEV